MTNQMDSLISRILSLREAISNLEAEAEELRVERSTLENQLMESMSNMGVTQLGSSLGTATMKTSTKWAIADWDALIQYCVENDSFDLVQKRISTKAVADRFAADEEVPGVQGVQVFSVSIRKK
jgi:hypothetical protein